jgi:hypothetical protein
MVNFLIEKWFKINLGTYLVPSYQKKEVMKITKNGNGHRGFWNPVKVFIRLVLQKWEKDDKVSGERYLVDSEDVMRDLDDIADEPQDESTDDVN